MAEQTIRFHLWEVFKCDKRTSLADSPGHRYEMSQMQRSPDGSMMYITFETAAKASELLTPTSFWIRDPQGGLSLLDPERVTIDEAAGVLTVTTEDPLGRHRYSPVVQST